MGQGFDLNTRGEKGVCETAEERGNRRGRGESELGRGGKVRIEGGGGRVVCRAALIALIDWLLSPALLFQIRRASCNYQVET